MIYSQPKILQIISYIIITFDCLRLSTKQHQCKEQRKKTKKKKSFYQGEKVKGVVPETMKIKMRSCTYK